MKILFLPKYTRIGASSRLRTYQYLTAVRSAGHEATIYPLFNDSYLADRYKGGIRFVQLVSAYFTRLLQLFSLWRYDLVVIEKELFPYLPSFFEYVIARLGVRYIVDYDDAIFHNYDSSKYFIVRFLLSNKISRVMKNAIIVIAGNSYLAQKAIAAGTKRVELLPTVIDLKRYGVKDQSTNAVFTIGWIGTPFTFKYVTKLVRVFERLSEQYPIALHLIGTHKGLGLPKIEKIIPWSEDTEVSEIQQFDVGIMPLDDSPWEQGKCSYKLIQYMGCGIPVIASPIGMNKTVILEGENGFLAANEENWYIAIEKLILDTSLRKKMGLAGYRNVQNNYSLAKSTKQYIHFLNI